MKEITIRIVRIKEPDPDIPGFWRTQVEDGDVVIRDDTQDIAGEGNFHSFILALECAKARAIQIAAR